MHARCMYVAEVSDILLLPFQLKSGTVIVTLKKSTAKEWPFLTGREKKLKDARE